MSGQSKYILGLDGGGTKTDVLLVAEDGTALSQTFGGSTNMQVVGVQKAAETIFRLLKECCKKHGCSLADIYSTVLGLAGAGRESDRAELLTQLQAIASTESLIFHKIIIETDARIAVEAAFAGAAGIVLIAGTGSVALYRTDDNRMLRAGGWGKILGDEGSGYAIARNALSAVMLEYDGRGQQTSLTAKALDYFAVKTPEDLLTKIYSDKVDIQGFTTEVLCAAEKGDQVAMGILENNANELVRLIQVLITKSKERKRYPVALMGGMLESENTYSKLVKEKLVQAIPNVLIMKPKFPPVFGAVMLGLNAFN